MSNKILVTGASGFVGVNLSKKLINNNYNVVLTSRNLSSELDSVNKGKYSFISLDLTDKSKVNSFDFSDIRTVLHIASTMPESLDPFDDAFPIIKSNFIGTLNLFNNLKNLDFILYLSSVDIYGNNSNLPLKESNLTKPSSNYGLSKLISEKFLEEYASNIPLTILRSSHIYGVGEKVRKVIPKFITSALKKEPLTLFGDGEDLRDYVYIDDVVDSIILALNKKSSGIYNIGSGKPHSIQELARLVNNLTLNNNPIHYRDRIRPRIDSFCDISKAQKELFYYPKTDLESGLKKEIKYFQSL